ncbi:aspartate aminotransferase-like [Anneissia japonica]|uniref:aspartate aminotransferase-like n=1 Tax=Anneissia japonica TaxID=1529436 RepID=UPI0014257099|nr:aspartate aminotransferase-like [Anneissia japonica]
MDLNTDKKWMNLLPTHLSGYNQASNLAQNEMVRKLVKEGETVYHFGFGQSPFPVMKAAQKALTEHTGENAYLPVAGLPELRASICKFHAKVDNFSQFDADDIVVGPGSKELIFLLMLVFNGDVMMLSPTWTTYKPQALLTQKKVHVIPTSFDNDWKLTPMAFLKAITNNNLEKKNKLLILCNPDNPTGTCYTEQELESLSEAFREHQVIVITDEIYARLKFDAKHVSLAKYYPEGTIVSSGISKWASAGGWRLGYSMYPKELSVLKNAVKSAASHTYSCASAPIQHASLTVSETLQISHYFAYCLFFLHSAFENTVHLTNYANCKEKLIIYNLFVLYLCRELTSVGVKVMRSQAGYYMLPDFEILRPYLKKRGISTCQQLCDALFDEARIAVIGGGPSFLRPLDEFTVRFCFVSFNGEAALEASRLIGQKDLPDDFVAENCQNVVDGVQALKNWMNKQMTLAD